MGALISLLLELTLLRLSTWKAIILDPVIPYVVTLGSFWACLIVWALLADLLLSQRCIGTDTWSLTQKVLNIILGLVVLLCMVGELWLMPINNPSEEHRMQPIQTMYMVSMLLLNSITLLFIFHR